MRIQKLSAKNRGEVSRLLRNYWNTREMYYAKRWTDHYLKEGHKIEIKKDQFFSIAEKGKLIGCISAIIYEGNVAELRDFIIKPEYRKKGLGRKTINEMIIWCRKQDVRKIYSLTFPSKQRFLSRLKFKKEGLLKSHFKRGEDMVIMSRFLK